jgi:hypothetical protein
VIPFPLTYLLELVECFRVSDAPYLIRRLARSLSLVCLVLFGDAFGMAAEFRSSAEETNIFRALASPQGAGTIASGWLCPSLMQLNLATGLKLMDLIDVARSRGVIASLFPLLCISAQSAEAYHGSSVPQWENEESNKLVDNVRCACFRCEFSLTDM